jgi:hypothetical protein
MRAGKSALLATIAVLMLCGGLSESANAFHFRHKQHLPKTPKMHYKPDKNAYLFGGKSKPPKKQHLRKGSYRTTLAGETIYAKH